MPPRPTENVNSIGQYLEEIGRHELLTAEQEVELAKTMETGREAEARLLGDTVTSAERQTLEDLVETGNIARETFIEANLRLVVSNAKRFMYKTEKLDLLDLIQEGNVGLHTAVDKFDYRRGFKFSTYATWWIRQAISRGISNTDETIRLPVHAEDRMRMVRNAESEFYEHNGRQPSAAEIAQFAGIHEEDVNDLLAIHQKFRRMVELDRPIGDKAQPTVMGELVIDSSVDVETEALDNVYISEVLDAIDEVLEGKEKDIFLKHNGMMGDEYTLERLGKEYGLTRERIRQIEKSAVGKLKARIDKNDLLEAI